MKDFFFFRRGVTLGIPESARPSVYRRMRGVRAERTLAVLAAAGALAIVFNVVELLGTAGLHAVYTQILSLRELPRIPYYGYLAVYNIAYGIDDSALLLIATVTLGSSRLQECGAR